MRPVDADALMAKLNRKKAGPANQRYTEGFNDCLMRVRSMVHSAPTLTPPNEWISVEERLPEEELNQIKRLFLGKDEVEVLVMIEGAYIATTLYWDGEKFYDEIGTHEVTHWMPLPVSPDHRTPEKGE